MTTLARDEIIAILDAEVKDPEVPVLSVVELGIVRDASSGAEGTTVTVTPTYSGCPAMREIEEEIVGALERHGLGPVTVKTVYSPAWTTDWIPEEAREKLRKYGIAPPGRADDSESLVQIVGRNREAVKCPYCGSANTVLRSEFGTTACKSILFCNACKQPFEQFKAI